MAAFRTGVTNGAMQPPAETSPSFIYAFSGVIDILPSMILCVCVRVFVCVAQASLLNLSSFDQGSFYSRFKQCISHKIEIPLIA